MNSDISRKPKLVGWGITNRCNLSCPHCYSSASKTCAGELTTEECFRALDALAAMGAERIGWTGGEPLLRLDLENLIERAAARGIGSGLTTNGTPLTPRRARNLKDAGLGAVQISLDGSTSDRNARIRAATAADFERVLRAIGIALETGFKVHLAMLIGAETLDDVRDYVRLATRMGVASVRFCGFVPWGNGKDDDARRRLDLRERLAELRSLVDELQGGRSPVVMFDPAFGPLPPDYGYHDCIAGMEMVYIDPRGNVYPCTSLLDERFRVGSLRERSIEALWADPRMTEIALYPKSKITGPCRDCECFESCGGGCRGITYAHTGDLDASFPVCLSRAEAGACVRSC